ncbi:MAG: DUF4595 domain-containing protein [Bacteroides sp.]|nr:DUF4595 domain-containing protein [Bacteroides sp.]
MKILRVFGMASFAALMCVNLAACGSSDDDPSDEPGGGGVVNNGKKISKIVGVSGDGSFSATLKFSYDSKGRLSEAVETEEEDGYKESDTYKFIWGDDIIKVNESSTYSGSTYTESYTLVLKDGLVQYEEYEDEDDTGTYTYNTSNRLIKFSDGSYWSNSAIWDGDKLVSIYNDYEEATISYGKSCQKGYFPFIAAMIEAGECALLFMAHPEIAGMRTTQLPTNITWAYDNYDGTESETSTIEYEFDKEGYISKIMGRETDSDGETSTYTYTLTWQ